MCGASSLQLFTQRAMTTFFRHFVGDAYTESC
jgi:hypothetical protein